MTSSDDTLNSAEPIDPYLASQIAAKNRRSVTKMALLSIRSTYPEGPIVAVEGDDDKVVYSHWISRCKPDLAYEFMVCGGKRQVRDLSNSLADDLGELKNHVYFIVDRDFNDLSGFKSASKLLMLCRYAVESYIVDPTCLDKTLSIAFPCNGSPAVRANIVRMFSTDLESFLTYTKELNFRVYVARQTGQEIDDHMPTSIDRFVSVSLNEVRAITHNLDDHMPVDVGPNVPNIVRMRTDFESLDPKLRYRGKFAFKFFTKWMIKLVEEFKSPSLGSFGNVGLGNGKVIHTEMSLGGYASRSVLPTGFCAFVKEIS